MAQLPWTRSDWLAEVSSWIRARVDVVGEIEQPHVRWWSTVLRVPTADGDLFFKAVAPVHRFEVLPTLLRELLAVRPHGLGGDERRVALAAVPRFEEMCTALAEDGLPETIQHDDLHDGQVFVRGDRYLVFDWGDSCLSHPFHSLTVTLRSIARRLELPPGGSGLRRLRDVYLEPFGRGPEIADIAYRTGTIARAIAWHRMVAPREPEFVDEDDLSGPAYGIKLFLEGGPIGSWREPES